MTGGNRQSLMLLVLLLLAAVAVILPGSAQAASTLDLLTLGTGETLPHDNAVTIGLRVAAFLIVSIFVLMSMDDLLVDLYALFGVRRKIKSRLHIRDLDHTPPQRIAIMVPAWQEEHVIAQMLENAISTWNYPQSFYHIFVGVYPNDLPTINAIMPLLVKYPNLHLSTNPQEGPTNKANNLNSVYRTVLAYEKENQMEFSILLIHDSEDIVHPTSLKLYNHLIPRYAAVQLPVFPLMRYPTIYNFFSQLTPATYADEFAENHFRAMVVRDFAGAYVPSAGTGYAAAREVFTALAREDGQVLDESSLTEDYELSLEALLAGYKTHFFLEALQRVADGKSHRTVHEFIATREFFPRTLATVVRQKARWIYGITFQSRQVLAHARELDAMQRYSLWRDRKARFANLLSLPGYTVLVYVILSLLIPLPPLFIVGTVAWWFTVFMTIMALNRQVMRAIAINEVYGWRSAVAGCFVPPLLPLRFVWGNILNFLATVRAWRIALFGSPRRRKKWDKTEHEFLPPEKLWRYRRKLGDLLLEKDLLTPRQLSQVLEEQEKSGKKLAQLIIEKGILPEGQVLATLGEQMHIGFVRLQGRIINPALAGAFPEHIARFYQVLPLLRWQDNVLLATCRILEDEEVAEIARQTDLRPHFTLATTVEVTGALDTLYSPAAQNLCQQPDLGARLLEDGSLEIGELLEAYRVEDGTGNRLGEVLLGLGLIDEENLEKALSTASSACAEPPLALELQSTVVVEPTV